MLHYIHAAITDSREMPTHIAIACSDLIALLEDLDEFVNTERAIEVWNLLVDDPWNISRITRYGEVHVWICVADILDKVKLIKNQGAESMEQY